MRTTLMITVLAFALPPDRPDPTPKEARPLLEQLQGEWQMVSSAVGGQRGDPNVIAGIVYVFNGKRLIARTPTDPKAFDYDIVLDPDRKPASIDFITKNTTAEVTYPGIIKLEAGTLTLCFQRDLGATRPSEFTSPANTQVALVQFRRIAK